MNAGHSDSSDTEPNEGSQGVRTLSDAKKLFANLARNGAADVQIKEPHRELGGGLLLVTASLVREDGARVNVAVYCYDDTSPAVVDWLPPIPEDNAGGWSQSGGNFR